MYFSLPLWKLWSMKFVFQPFQQLLVTMKCEVEKEILNNAYDVIRSSQWDNIHPDMQKIIQNRTVFLGLAESKIPIKKVSPPNFLFFVTIWQFFKARCPPPPGSLKKRRKISSKVWSRGVFVPNFRSVSFFRLVRGWDTNKYTDTDIKWKIRISLGACSPHPKILTISQFEGFRGDY